MATKRKGLTRDAILGIEKESRKIVWVDDVPGWGSVALRPMSQLQRDQFDQKMYEQASGTGDSLTVSLAGMKSLLLSTVIVDEVSGEPMFTVEEINQFSAKPLDILFTVAQEICGISGSGVEEKAKN
jgi:hypothetical protein